MTTTGSAVLSRRALLAAAAASGIGLAIAGPAAARPAAPRTAPADHQPAPTPLSLPAPTGPERLGTVSLHLVDRARTDPWLPSHPVRELMVGVWYPAESVRGHPAAPWIPPGVVPSFERSQGIPPGALGWPTTHAFLGAPVDRPRGRTGRPVVLYSPGFGSDRFLGTVLVEELASHGYVVVAIAHTHDAGEVEFPGGRVEASAIPPDIDDQTIAQAIAVREADTRFVLDQLAAINAGHNPDAENQPLPRDLRGAFDLSHTGMFGHSLGGATAAATMYHDRRVHAGANLDGTLFGAAATGGSDRPFLLFGSDPGAGPDDPSWDEFWHNQRGWKREVLLTGSTHGSFTDFETLVPQAAPALGLTPDRVTQMIGTGDPRRSIRAQGAYLRAFFDLHLRHRDGHLFDGPSRQYPEIRFARTDAP